MNLLSSVSKLSGIKTQPYSETFFTITISFQFSKKMIFKELRLFGLKTLDSTRFLYGLLSRDHHLIINPKREKKCFVIKNYLFSKATNLFNAQNGKLAQKRFEMFNHSLQGLECYEIWNTPVKENELLKCRGKKM